MGVGQREVLWNLAENASETDLNLMQRFIRAAWSDWHLGQAGGFQGAGDVGASGYQREVALSCIGDSCAPVPLHNLNLSTGTNRTVTNLPGPIGQWKSPLTFPQTLHGTATDPTIAFPALPANWGQDSNLMVYWAQGGEFATTHDIGDASPRWDLVCIQLNDVSNDVADQETKLQKQVVGDDFVISSAPFFKRRKVTATKQVVKGTPAGSPLIPAVPVGFVPYYAVLIPALFNGLIPVDNNFHDYRFPVGSFTVDMFAYDQRARQGAFGAPFTVIPGAYSSIQIGPSGSINRIEFMPSMPVSPHSCRLIGVSALTGQITEPPVVEVARYNPIGAGAFFQMGGNATWDLSSSFLLSATTIGDYRWQDHRLAQAAGNLPNADFKPPWGTGWPSGYASRRERLVGDNSADQIGIRWTVNNSAGYCVISMVRMYFAGMPY